MTVSKSEAVEAVRTVLSVVDVSILPLSLSLSGDALAASTLGPEHASQCFLLVLYQICHLILLIAALVSLSRT
jgi:hypothetical protein